MPNSSSPQRTTLRRKVLNGFGVVLLMLAIIATISVQSTRGFIRTSEQVANAHEAVEIQERMLRNVAEMESSCRAFLAVGDEDYLNRYESAQTEIIRGYNVLREVNQPGSQQPQILDRLRELLQKTFALQRSFIEQRRTDGASSGVGLLKRSEAESPMSEIRALLEAAQTDERKILADRADLTERISRSTIGAVIAGSVLTMVALIIACLLILRDLEARQRAERALAQEHNLLSSIINAMPNHVYVKDAKGRFILDNSAHRQHLGLEVSQSIEGRTVFDYFSFALASKYDADDHLVMGTGRSILGQEEESLRNGENREMWLETNKVPLLDTDGKIVGLVGVSSDISARKDDEEKLRRFADQLERSNQELQSFASVASHDLQEPLRKIQAFGDRLQAKCGEALGEQGRDYLARMQNAAQRMQTLIQDLLKLARVTSRAQPFEPCNLGEIVQQVLSDLEIATEQSAARVEVGSLPTIDADPLHMRQLFQNLIANALKFQKPGEPPEIRISGREFEVHEHLIAGAWPGDRVCQIRVEDNGIGFDEQFAEQIFIVFQRLHSRDEYAGTGIGLAVCRKITDRHGGSIVAKSSPGQGASFIITLPVKQPIAPAHE
jgi:PAS domain S-box-containing protein